ncbi:carbohydrate ABC transporter permease [Paenibacillus sp. CGMCC 1.16610]|uniref:Carbohydrate ABC transporter permease n=2 Tax=Paenibacillus TaxID=44249 RepID=A0ABU6DD14_9BACL|nr:MULTISPECIES: carbohydrate ABC transporter permease [Paenibacillus]MBA2939126.1 carbohydrate ABC transporter permease [Paenibacillus sp. CGMCC 1.16610]MCY9662943.1 carbohydrate ABC transporter permease [Paenibacillus anseongense]MEB4795564.1 carbohydrate ABC transporter permease [Paenibacillus chondroitinus]MVQ35085.1 ABC transporter permease subunit [Paenibacillus anseongense]
MKEGLGNRLFNIGNIVLLGLVGIITFFPLYYVFVVSFTDPTEYLKESFVLFPKVWSLESYKFLMATGAFPKSIGVSVYVTLVGTALSLIFTASLAYTLSRKRLRGRRFALIAILITILFNPGMIPNYMLVRNLHLIDSLWSLILPALASGWNVILMKGFFDSIPAELEESASMDGCNDLSTFFRIILPLSLPSLAAFGLFYAVAYWNQFFNALIYINDASKWPLQVMLQNILLNANNTDLRMDVSSVPPPSETLKMAAVIVATVPILVVYPFLQKHFAKGAMVGSVKG